MGKTVRFDPHWQRKRKLKFWWRRWRWAFALVPLVAIAVWARSDGWGGGEWQPVSQQFPVCGSGQRASGCVIDGDTIAIGQRRIRLTGYDAPELDGECENERLKAVEAQFELSRWLSAGSFELQAGDRARDTYGRELLEARRDGVSLADHMMGKGLAEQGLFGFAEDWGRTDWCP